MNGFNRSKKRARVVDINSTKPVTTSGSACTATGVKATTQEKNVFGKSNSMNETVLDIKYWLRELRLDQIKNKKIKT